WRRILRTVSASRDEIPRAPASPFGFDLMKMVPNGDARTGVCLWPAKNCPRFVREDSRQRIPLADCLADESVFWSVCADAAALEPDDAPTMSGKSVVNDFDQFRAHRFPPKLLDRDHAGVRPVYPLAGELVLDDPLSQRRGFFGLHTVSVFGGVDL